MLFSIDFRSNNRTALYTVVILMTEPKALDVILNISTAV